MGQFFLHEMMHLHSVGNPHNEYVSDSGNGISAYGPKYVHKLATPNLRSGGGATRASTNADTYVWLANCLYLFELTKYFPKPLNYKLRDIDIVGVDEGSDDQSPIMLNLGDFDRETATDDELQNRVDNELQGYGSSGDLEGTAACWKHDVSISVDTADSLIEGFCQEISLSGRVLVPASKLQGENDERVTKVIRHGIALPGRDEKLFFEVSLLDNSCSDGYPLSVGDNDEQKVEHCKTRFRKILDDCEAAETGLGAGCDYIDKCGKYSIRLS